MKTSYLILFLCIFSSAVLAQNTSDESCYSVTKVDTVWKSTCASMQEIPNYPGGDGALFSFLGKNTVYPKTARELGVQGKIFVTFIIDKGGEVTDVEIYRGLKVSQELLDKYKDNEKQLSMCTAAAKEIEDESFRVVQSMPKWSPGVQNGKPVRVRYVLPLNFKL